MIDVELITIDVRMPKDEVRIVAMQPFIRLHSTTEEPFRWSIDTIDMQLAAIHRTLDIAQGGFSGLHANFTLFPEYSIPGIVGVNVINDRISAVECSNEIIIIAGIHGLLKDEYKTLCDMLTANVSESNAPESIPNDKWVNCCVIWVKDRAGVIKIWVQPKIRPAWPEMNVTCNDMFHGSNVYVFEGKYEPNGYPCRFVSLICFDWVASVAGATVREELLKKLNAQWVGTQPALDLIFVIQHNSKPNHPSFLLSTFQFLTDPDYAFVQRDKAIVIHANSAVSPTPAGTGKGGFSACVFSPTAQLEFKSCRPTVCMQTGLLRKTADLGHCIDVVFREMGECIHSFTVSIPRFITPSPTGRALPLPMANVYAVCDSIDPRLPGGPVPGAVKWLSDSLDGTDLLSESELAGCPLEMTAKAIEPTIINAMRTSNGHSASHSVNYATCSYSRGKEKRNESHRINSDIWGAEEADAIKHVLHSLTSLGLAYSLEFESTTLHSAIKEDKGFVQIVAIHGDTHEDCRLHYDKFVLKSGIDPVLVIARDKNNLVPTADEYLRIYETIGDSGLAFLDYQTLITNCRTSTDRQTLKNRIDISFPRHARII